jgi:hypothetical protein
VREVDIDASSRKNNNRQIFCGGIDEGCAGQLAGRRMQRFACSTRDRIRKALSQVIQHFSFSKIIILETDNAYGISPPANIKLASFFLFFSPFGRGHGGLFLISAFGKVECFLFHKGF